MPEPSCSLIRDPREGQSCLGAGGLGYSLPPQAVAGGELGPTLVQVPFSLQDLRQSKTDLGSFSDDPDKVPFVDELI